MIYRKYFVENTVFINTFSHDTFCLKGPSEKEYQMNIKIRKTDLCLSFVSKWYKACICTSLFIYHLYVYIYPERESKKEEEERERTLEAN